MSVDEMKTLLSESVCEVGFMKMNGEFRLMKCTTSSKFIPEQSLPKETTDDGPSYAWPENVVRVYDVTAEGWRSFRVENVTSFNQVVNV